MKLVYTLTTVLFFISVTTLSAQYAYTVDKIDAGLVPEAAVNAFENTFSDVKVIRWEKHSGKGKKKTHVKYVVIFDDNGLRNRARYKTDGTGISATTYYWFKKGLAKLPATVRQYATANHPGFKLNSGEKVVSLRSSRYVYRIRLRKGTSKLVTYINESGEMISKNNLPSELKEDENEK